MPQNAADPKVDLDVGKIRLAIGDPDTPGLVLLTILLWTFGPRVFGDPEEGVERMDPAELWAETNETYGSWITEQGENKVNALLVGLTDEGFWQDIEIFKAVCTSLIDGDLGDLVAIGMEDLAAVDIMWAVLEMELAWDNPDTPEFSSEIDAYINRVIDEEQDDHRENSHDVEKNYYAMIRQMEEIGVPADIIRHWEDEYAMVMSDLRED